MNIDVIGVTQADIIEEKATDPFPRLPIDPLVGFNPNLPNKLLSISIRIGDFKLETDLREILYFGRTDLSEQDDREIDRNLDACTEYRISVGIAYAYLKQTVEEAESDLTVFEAEQLEAAHRRIFEKKKALRGGKITQDVVQASKDEKLAEMLSISTIKKKWQNKLRALADLRRDVLILQRVDKALEDRPIMLMGIAKRRFTERTKLTLT